MSLRGPLGPLFLCDNLSRTCGQRWPLTFDLNSCMRLNSRRTWIALAAVVAAAAALLAFRGRDKEIQYQTTTVDRGDIVDVVGATGTLQAVTTVHVGSQVS